MSTKLISFIKSSYKIVLGIIFVVAFFILYNHFLVDQTIVNLKVALDRLASVETPEELQRIKPLLKMVLVREISKAAPSNIAIGYIETAISIIESAKDRRQIEDIKFLIESLIKVKRENGPGAFLALLDNFNSRIYPPEVKSTEDFSGEQRNINSEIGLVKDEVGEKVKLQNLYFSLANTYLRSEDYIKAEENFLKVIALDPKSVISLRAKFSLAWVYKERMQYQKSVNLFKEVSEAVNVGDLSAIGKFEQAGVLFKQGDYSGSADLYAQLSTQYPGFSLADLALYEVAHLSFYYLQDRKSAFEYLSVLEEKFPDSKVVKFEMSNFKPVLSEEYAVLGYDALKKKDYLQAITMLREGLRYDSQSGACHAGLALAYFWLKDKVLALTEARKAVSVGPHDEVGVINSLFVFIVLEEIDEAVAVGEEALLGAKFRKAEFYYNLGYAYARKAELRKAEKNFSRTIKLDPEFSYAYNNLGCSYWSSKDYTQSIRKFKEAIAHNPNYTDAHFNLGAAYLYLNQYQDAYKELVIVLKIDPNYPQVKEYLAKITTEFGYVPE